MLSTSAPALQTLGAAFKKKNPALFRGKPRDLILSAFCLWLQSEDADLSMWGEESWTETLLFFGFPERRIPTLLEQMASWGVTDTGTWLSPQEMVGLAGLDT